jgi:hypothetical protein
MKGESLDLPVSVWLLDNCSVKETKICWRCFLCGPPQNFSLVVQYGARGSIVVKALCFKPQGRGFQALRGECLFFFFPIYLTLPATLGPGVHSASIRNEYQKQKNNVSGE